MSGKRIAQITALSVVTPLAVVGAVVLGGGVYVSAKIMVEELKYKRREHHQDRPEA